MKDFVRKRSASLSALLAIVVLCTTAGQALLPRCFCGPACPTRVETSAAVVHSCCQASHQASAPVEMPGASLGKRCTCPPVLHDSVLVITNTAEYGVPVSKACAVTPHVSGAVSGRVFTPGASDGGPPPKQGIPILKQSLRC